MSRLQTLTRRYGFEGLIVAGAIGAALEAGLRHHPARASYPSLWIVVPGAALIVLVLLARRRYSFAAPAALWLLAAALSFVDGDLVGSSASLFAVGMVASFLLGQVRDVVQGRTGLVLIAFAAAIVVYKTPGHTAGSFVFTPGLFALAWLAGFAMRERTVRAESAEARAATAEHEREIAGRIAVAEERARIARELHDIVAHAVSVMVLRVGAVRHGLPDALEEDRAALIDAEQTGRRALTEMRRLLGAMRREGDDLELAPQPGIDRLGSLVETVERAGPSARLRIEGDPFPLPRALELSTYRVVQEGLTNALKHADARQVDVLLRYAPDELRVEVRDDGHGPTSNDGFGHGLIGVRERVTIYGGEMTTSTAPDGGFVLATRFPVPKESQ